MKALSELVFLGTGACIPPIGNDTASYLLDGEILIDTGWHVTDRLRRAGHTPGDVRHLFFTHLHHDHTMALPALLYEFYTAVEERPLCIYAHEGIRRMLDDVDAFLQKDVYWPEHRRPEIKLLKDGDSVRAGDYDVSVMASDHAVPGCCYRFHHRQSGRDIGFTGDTAYMPKLSEFFRGCELLMHEFSFGLRKQEPNLSRHSDICDAATVARDADVGVLIPVHGPTFERPALEAAIREIYHGKVIWPEPNERVLF